MCKNDKKKLLQLSSPYIYFHKHILVNSGNCQNAHFFQSWFMANTWRISVFHMKQRCPKSSLLEDLNSGYIIFSYRCWKEDTRLRKKIYSSLLWFNNVSYLWIQNLPNNLWVQHLRNVSFEINIKNGLSPTEFLWQLKIWRQIVEHELKPVEN